MCYVLQSCICCFTSSFCTKCLSVSLQIWHVSEKVNVWAGLATMESWWVDSEFGLNHTVDRTWYTFFFNLLFFTRNFGFYFYLVSYPFLVTLLLCCVFCRLLYYSVSSSYLVNIGKGKISMRRRTRSNRSEKWLDSQQDHSANIWSWGLLILIRFVREALEL